MDTNKDTPDSFFDDLSFGTTYSGQQKDETGCGHIEDPSLYVNSRYDNGWSLYKNKSLSMATENNTQSYLSCYYEHFYKGNDAYYSTEGSCWFVSAYNVLQSIADATGSYKTAVNKLKTDSNKDRMPKKNELETYVPCESEPSLYRQVHDENGNNITKKVYSSDGKNWMYSKTLVAKSRNFPKLYNVVRNYVVNTYGKVDGGTVYDTASIINNIGSKYGYSFKARGTVLAGLYGSSGFTAIDKNLPFVLCTATVSNAGYGDHLMAGCGYKIYKKTSGWWIFKFTSYKYFYELRDGHNNQPMYIDMSALCGFGGIVLLDYGFFKY